MENKQNVTKKFDFIAFITKYDYAMLILVTLLGFILATFLLIISNRNPADMFDALLQSLTGYNSKRGTFNARYIGEWINTSVPLILCGLSVGFAFKAGLFNIGAEGQYIMGLTFAQIIANNFPVMEGVHLIIAILVAAIAGALWGGLVGFLKGKFQVSEIISTIMLNYIAFYFSRWITVIAIENTNSFRTPDYPDTALLFSDFFREITNNSILNNGLFIMMVCVVLYYIIIQKTTLGLSVKASGYNSTAAMFSGMSTPTKNAFISMAIAGTFAGLAGAIVALGSFNYGRVLSSQDGYGFMGISVALVGNAHAFGMVISGLLFGMLQTSQSLMQTRDIPKEIVNIISGLVVIFISLAPGIKMFLLLKNRKNKDIN